MICECLRGAGGPRAGAISGLFMQGTQGRGYLRVVYAGTGSSVAQKPGSNMHRRCMRAGWDGQKGHSRGLKRETLPVGPAVGTTAEQQLKVPDRPLRCSAHSQGQERALLPAWEKLPTPGPASVSLFFMGEMLSTEA